MCVYVYIYMYMRWSTNIQFHIDGMQEFESNSNEEKKIWIFKETLLKKDGQITVKMVCLLKKKLRTISGNLWALQHNF